jgi:hypothetical protein
MYEGDTKAIKAVAYSVVTTAALCAYLFLTGILMKYFEKIFSNHILSFFLAILVVSFAYFVFIMCIALLIIRLEKLKEDRSKKELNSKILKENKSLTELYDLKEALEKRSVKLFNQLKENPMGSNEFKKNESEIFRFQNCIKEIDVDIKRYETKLKALRNDMEWKDKYI